MSRRREIRTCFNVALTTLRMLKTEGVKDMAVVWMLTRQTSGGRASLMAFKDDYQTGIFIPDCVFIYLFLCKTWPYLCACMCVDRVNIFLSGLVSRHHLSSRQCPNVMP